MRQVDDTTTLVSAATAFAENSHFEYAETQPSRDGEKTSSCQTGHRRPASTVFPTLSGDAIDYSCEEVTAKGEKYHFRQVWLYDYGVSLPVDTNDDEGLTGFELKSVTITPAVKPATISSIPQ
jgi:hypothetical protein